MKASSSILLLTILVLLSITVNAQETLFDFDKDLLLVQFDCKTDVDDIHTMAALATLLADPDYSSINYYAVAGTYGIQEGLYVPPNDVMELAFGDNWSDAHTNPDKALNEVFFLLKETVSKGGDIWIADAGQSDFSAKLVEKVRAELPDIYTKNRIHVVQHSDWNESVTTPELLTYVKEHADYHKIPDGNSEGNGTPGFRSPGYTEWEGTLSDAHLKEVWQLAVETGNTYNAAEGRYDNEAISSGGLDFSDLSEVCYILGLADIYDSEEFFDRFGR